MSPSTYHTLRRVLWFAGALAGGIALRDVLHSRGSNGMDQAKYLADMSEAVRLGQELQRRRPPDGLN